MQKTKTQKVSLKEGDFTAVLSYVCTSNTQNVSLEPRRQNFGLGLVSRVARCSVFDRTVRFFGDMSGQKMDLNRTMSRPVFGPLLVIYSGMCILAV